MGNVSAAVNVVTRAISVTLQYEVAVAGGLQVAGALTPLERSPVLGKTTSKFEWFVPKTGPWF